jgi:hypothetical protein
LKKQKSTTSAQIVFLQKHRLKCGIGQFHSNACRTMATNTLDGVCSTCDGTIDYDGATENYVMCDGYCRQTFHVNCLNLGVPVTFWKQFRARKEFLFFCSHCRELQKNFVVRRNFLEAERNVAGLVEILQTATRDVDAMCRGAVASVNAAVSSLNAKTAETSVVDLVSPKTNAKTRRPKKKKVVPTTTHDVITPIVTVTADRSAQRTSTPKEDEDNDEFLTPLPHTSKKRTTTKGFFGTANAASQISAAVERKDFVISRVHPSTTPDGIVDFIKQNTGVVDVRCQLMLPRGRTVADLDYVSFKISATEADYDELMKPEVWPTKVLVRDFVRNNRRQGAGATGFHKF